jgi:phosphopantetheine--protein transferase-like protein
MPDAPEVDVEVILASLPHDREGSTANRKVALSELSAMLDPDERTRAGAYRIAEPAQVFTLARGLLRAELSRRLGERPQDIHFDVRPSGKPDVRASNSTRPNPTRPDWRFSVSHTGPHVCIAFALGRDVGVDIERASRSVRPLDIAKRYFTAREFQTLEALPEALRTRAFYAGWTRKEAIVKARGLTMAESLTTLSVDLEADYLHPGYEDASEASDRAACRLTTFENANFGLVGAVAVLGHLVPRLKIEVLSVAPFD